MENIDLPSLLVAIIGGLTVALVSAIIAAIIKVVKDKKATSAWIRSEIENKMIPAFGEETCNLVMSSLFIPTYGQLYGPHNSENEESTDGGNNTRFLLVDKILKENFTKQKVLGKKRYLILGGSGMGKSSFSASLFYEYISKYYKKMHFPIYAFSMEKDDVLDRIQDILNSKESNCSQAILILDALDESSSAIQDFDSFFDKLNRLVDSFKFVIITCRTQFFEDEEKEPTAIPIPQPTKNGWNMNIFMCPLSTKEKYSCICRINTSLVRLNTSMHTR